MSDRRVKSGAADNLNPRSVFYWHNKTLPTLQISWSKFSSRFPVSVFED